MITKTSSLIEVAAIISDSLEKAGITATLSGGSVVSIYSDNSYLSKDLDFVTAELLSELEPVLKKLGFIHTGTPRLSQFEHPDCEWYVEFLPSPLAFGNLQIDHSDCKSIDVGARQLRIITPTHSVMDRLAAALHWKDMQSHEQAVLVAASQEVDWEQIRGWFLGEGETKNEYERFLKAVSRKQLSKSREGPG